MRQTRTWLYVFLPLLYIAIVFGFVGLQFSEKSDSFSQSLGDLTLTGKNAGAQGVELSVRGLGLEFSFDANRPLVVQQVGGGAARLRPVSWAWKDGNVVIDFQQGVQLTFEKAGARKGLFIRPVANDALRKVSSIQIAFAPESGVRLTRPTRSSLVELNRDKSRTLVSVDGAQDRIQLDNTFVLVAGPSGFRPARLDVLAPGQDAELAWLTLDDEAGPGEAETALSRYWDRAWASWPSARVFTTRLVDAWGREAVLRDTYATTAPQISNLLARDRSAWGFDAALFLGNIVELTSQYRRAVEATSSRSQPDWTGQGRLWWDARLYGPDGSADRVADLLQEGRLPESPSGLIAFFQNLRFMDAERPSEAVAARILEVTRVLKSQLVRREGSLFVQTGTGLLDLRSSLLLGRLWLEYGKTLSNEAYALAGARLVLSALEYQDGNGRLPEILVTQEGKVVRQEGTLLPEDLYVGLRPAPNREVLVPQWGPSAFVLAPRPPVSQGISASEARFSFRFPVGSAEHIVLSGVPAFDHITLHGIRWRTDPQFQSYTDGWAYSASTKTLYVKIKHREEIEELIVHFQPE